MTISKFEIENAAKKVDEIEALKKSAANSWTEYCAVDKERQELRAENETLKQKSLNRLIEIERLKELNEKLIQALETIVKLDSTREDEANYVAAEALSNLI